MSGPPIRVPVFAASLVGVLIMATWALAAPTSAESALGTATGWVTEWFGWFYVLLATAVLVFVLYLGISRYGHIRLWNDPATPEFHAMRFTLALPLARPTPTVDPGVRLILARHRPVGARLAGDGDLAGAIAGEPDSYS